MSLVLTKCYFPLLHKQRMKLPLHQILTVIQLGQQNILSHSAVSLKC